LETAPHFRRILHLRYPDADFDQTIYEADRALDTVTIERLENCSWIDEKKNLLITGSSGAGKTYLANAFCVAACHQSRSVRYYSTGRLINELKRSNAQDSDTYLAFTDELAGYDLLVIDDFGFMSLDLDDCRYLFEVLEQRETVKSTMVISQFAVNQWYDFFGQKTYADACLRRMTAGAYRIEMNGRDMSPAEPEIQSKKKPSGTKVPAKKQLRR
jgi:DNA replication protein DnaC